MTAKRAMASGLVVLFLLGGGGSLYFAAASQSEDILQALDRLAAYEATISSQPELEAQLESIRQQSASLAGLINATTAALAAASMQNDVRSIASQIGGEVRSTQNLPPSALDSFEKIEIACEVTLPRNRLKDLLYQIESHTPYLFLDRINVEVPQNLLPRGERAQPRVDIQFVVRGYRWVGA